MQEVAILPNWTPWKIQECCGTDSSQGDTDESFPYSTESACGARKCSSAMEHPEAGSVALLMPGSGFQNLFLQPAALAGHGVKGVSWLSGICGQKW